MTSLMQHLRAWMHERTAPARPASVLKPQQRMYHAARVSRLTDGWSTAQTSADTELYSSLYNMRGRSRALIRDSAYAKRAKTIVVNNIIGAGMGLQGNVRTKDGKLLKAVNDGIEAAWHDWCRADACHTGGAVHFGDFERLAMGEVFEAGEVFIRLHLTRFGSSAVPLALELIEAERLADDFARPVSASGDNEVRMGIEVDRFGRAVAYWFRERHPGELRYSIGQTDNLLRVPADQVKHLRIVERWPQTRGAPWLHTTMRRLNDMDGYSEAEIIAARASANYMGFIVDPNGSTAPVDEMAEGEAGIAQPTMTLEPGLVRQLAPGEDIKFHDPNRPNSALEPFLRYMLREVAAGTGVSYASLSADYSQSNYSSSRLALLDDRDLWRVYQQWWIRTFREPLHRVWLRQAVYGSAIEGQASEIDGLTVEAYLRRPRYYEAVRFKPRGWNWVDPTKEVEAFKEAVRCGFTTVGDVISQTGNGLDLEDVLEARASELELMEEYDLVFDTDPAKVEAKGAAAPAPEPNPEKPDDGEEGDPPARVSLLAEHRDPTGSRLVNFTR